MCPRKRTTNLSRAQERHIVIWTARLIQRNVQYRGMGHQNPSQLNIWMSHRPALFNIKSNSSLPINRSYCRNVWSQAVRTTRKIQSQNPPRCRRVPFKESLVGLWRFKDFGCQVEPWISDAQTIQEEAVFISQPTGQTYPSYWFNAAHPARDSAMKTPKKSASQWVFRLLSKTVQKYYLLEPRSTVCGTLLIFDRTAMLSKQKRRMSRPF